MAEIKFTEVTCVKSNVVVEIKNKSKHNNPAYATAGAAGMDLKADINEPQVIEARGSIVIPTGIYIKLPEGYEAQIRSRSGLAFNYNIQAHVGTIN